MSDGLRDLVVGGRADGQATSSRRSRRRSDKSPVTGRRSDDASSSLAALLKARRGGESEAEEGASLADLVRRSSSAGSDGELADLLASRAASDKEHSDDSADCGATFNLGWDRLSRFVDGRLWQKMQEAAKGHGTRHYSMKNRNKRQRLRKDTFENNGMSVQRIRKVLSSKCHCIPTLNFILR